MSSKPKLQMPDVERLLAQAAKREEKEKQLKEINPFGTGLKVVPNDGGVKTMQISGSTAGAGSGEFHVYRAQRRTELTRLENMKTDAELEKINSEFQARRNEAKAIEEKKKSKKAAKRKRNKEKQKEKKAAKRSNGDKTNNDDDDEDNESGSEEGDEKNNKKNDDNTTTTTTDATTVGDDKAARKSE